MVAWVLACTPDDPTASTPAVPDEGTGPLGTGFANPFPNAHLVGDDGHLALRDLPDVGPTPLDLDRLALRTGFSPAQVSVLRLGGVDPAVLPAAEAPTPGAGAVQMFDLTDGRPLPCFAELDAWPTDAGAAPPALLVRPLEALRAGHDIAVVVTTEAVPRPERFDLLLSERPPASLVDVAPDYRALVDALGALGVPEGDIAVTWQFPVSDGREPLPTLLAGLALPGEHALGEVREVDAGDTVPPYTWRAAEGTFRVQNWLVDDRKLAFGPDGLPALQGEADADLYVHIPTSVADAPAGTVPVVVFGHGIFGSPGLYLDDADDGSRVLQLAEEAQVIVLATTWRGLTTSDLTVPILVASDFGRFPELTDLLVQAQVNTRTLLEEASRGGLLADPVFQGRDGQLLPDPSRISYYGISLGAIEGAVLLANAPPIDHAALHVGGAMWSTMLERSSNWGQLEPFLVDSIPDPSDRQVLYALSQLWWDPVDPMSYVEALASKDFLLQESVGDDQVPNLTTEAFARSVGLPALSPIDVVPFGLATEAQPSRAFVRFDPQRPLPPAVNRPAPVTLAHDTPRTWDGARLQVVDHLADGAIVHHCGAEPCRADNTGE